MADDIDDLLQRDAVVRELHTDLYIMRWHTQRMREMYVKHLGGQWLCEGCGAVQAAETPSMKTDDELVHLCQTCYQAVVKDAKRNRLDAKRKARALAREGRMQ
jgi:hypothetical protein